MQSIVLFGAGNVAVHLFEAFQNAEDTEVVQVYNRSAQNLAPFLNRVPTTTSLSEIKPADIYLISISDGAVPQLTKKLSNSGALIAHTSGSNPLFQIANRNGVLYPLQTFSRQTAVDFKRIPLCIEADSREDLDRLKLVGQNISEKVYEISTEQRKSLHLSAVFACNFTNHLYRLAEKICKQNDIPFSVLHPLIRETAQKARNNSPKPIQTGPARRGDQKTIDHHLSQLKSAELKEIYTLLTHSIQAEYESEL